MPSAQPHWSAWCTACSSVFAHILWCSSSLKEMHNKHLMWLAFRIETGPQTDSVIVVNREENSEMSHARDNPHIWRDSLTQTSSLSFTENQRSAWEEPQTPPKPNKKFFCWWLRTQVFNPSVCLLLDDLQKCEKRRACSLSSGSMRRTPGSLVWSAAPGLLSGFPATWLGTTSLFV